MKGKRGHKNCSCFKHLLRDPVANEIFRKREGVIIQGLKKDRLDEEEERAVFDAVNFFRTVISTSEHPPTKELIERGSIKKVFDVGKKYVKNLKDVPPRKEVIQLFVNVTWTLTNAVYGSTTDAKYVVEALGVIDFILEVLPLALDDELRQNCIWCLCNIMGESSDFRSLVLQKGALPFVLQAIQEKGGKYKWKTLALAARFYKYVVHWAPLPQMSDMNNMFLGVRHILENCNSNEPIDCLRDVLHCLMSCLEKKDGEVIHANVPFVIKSGVVPFVLRYMVHSNIVIHGTALRIIGNMVMGDKDATHYLVYEAKCIRPLLYLANAQKYTIRKEALWSLSNLCMDGKELVECIMTTSLGKLSGLDVVMYCLQKDTHEVVRREAAWVLLTFGVTKKLLRLLCKKGCISLVVAFLYNDALRCKEKLLFFAVSFLEKCMQLMLTTQDERDEIAHVFSFLIANHLCTVKCTEYVTAYFNHHWTNLEVLD